VHGKRVNASGIQAVRGRQCTGRPFKKRQPELITRVKTHRARAVKYYDRPIQCNANITLICGRLERGSVLFGEAIPEIVQATTVPGLTVSRHLNGWPPVGVISVKVKPTFKCNNREK